MYSLRLGNAADTSDFDIDNLTAAEFNRCFCRLIAVDAFVQTDRGLYLFLQFGMIDDVVCCKGLFNHHQINSSMDFSSSISSRVYAEFASTIKGMSGNLSRIFLSISTSRPGFIFTLMRL